MPTMLGQADINSQEQLSGLSEAEAASRIARYGFNELPSSQPRSVLMIALGVAREPMLLLLLACGTTYLWLGDLQEAIILLIFVLVVMAITLYQERKTERALDALRDLSSPRALVIRGGERRRIAGRDVVPGDILVLSEGDRVPADAILLSAVNLSTDESLLTGESVSVRKQAATADAEMARAGGTIFLACSREPWLFEAQDSHWQRPPVSILSWGKSASPCGSLNNNRRSCRGTYVTLCGCWRWELLRYAVPWSSSMA